MQGFDCSGLAIELLKAGSKFPEETDMTAQDLYNKYFREGAATVNGEAHALAFYGMNKRSITHMGYMIDDKYIIEAAGGDKNTLTIDDAIRDKAWVRIRPLGYRRDLQAVLLPK